MKFHGLSSPEDLTEMWRILKRDDDVDDINIIWDYTSPKQILPGFNIVNILYNPKAPDETGHYCLIYDDTHTKSILFYNPVAEYTDLDEEKLLDLYAYFVGEKKYPEENMKIDLTGKQKATSENCGYHCLAKAFTIYMKNEGITTDKVKVEVEKESEIEKEGGAAKDKPTDSAEELLYSILKNVRGIYFGLRDGWENTAIQKKKKEKASGYASGLADYVPKGQTWSYSRLKNRIEGGRFN